MGNRRVWGLAVWVLMVTVVTAATAALVVPWTARERRDLVLLRRWAADPNGVLRLVYERGVDDPNATALMPGPYRATRTSAFAMDTPMLTILYLDIESELQRRAETDQ